MKEKVSILGNGSFGCALAASLSVRNELFLWGRDEKIFDQILRCQGLQETKVDSLPGIAVDFSKVIVEKTLERAISRSSLLLMAVPSHAIGSLAAEIKPFITEKHVLVSLAKGIERNSFKTMSEVIEDTLAGSRFQPENIAAFSGPTHAEEIAQGKPTLGVIACKKTSLGEHLCQVFHSENLKTYTHRDIVGLELGGMLKNIIAIAVGIAEAKNMGMNAQAALATRGLIEMGRYLDSRSQQTTRPAKTSEAKQLKVNTLYGLSGVGDLMATCFSKHSRNRRFGFFLGKGLSLEAALSRVGQTVEGYYALSIVAAEAEKKNIYMPITRSLYQVLFEGKKTELALKELMSMTDTQEFGAGT